MILIPFHQPKKSLAAVSLVVVLASVWISSSDAFVVAPAHQQASSRRTIQASNTVLYKKRVANLEKNYGEQSRKFRRDQFSYEKWVRHRANTRFSRNIKNLAKSGVVRQLLSECIFIASVATFIVMFNAYGSVGWDDFSGVHHGPIADWPTFKMPLQPFTLSSPALGLLLVFRTNVSYQRWDEARKAWGVVVNNSRTVARQTSAWIQQSDLPFEEKQRLLRRCADCVWAFPRSLTRHLLSEQEDEENYCIEVRGRLLDKDFAEELIRWKRHRPSRALFEMSNAVNELPLEMYRRISVDEAVSHLCDAMGGCDRIFTSPVPLVYTRHTARFLEIWLLLLPLALWDILGDSWNHWATIPVSLAINFFFLGIEELSIQLEEPFSILPLHIISDGIGKSAEEHFDWNEKDSLGSMPHYQSAVYEQPTIPPPSAPAPPEPVFTNSYPYQESSSFSPLPPQEEEFEAPEPQESTTDQYASLADALRSMTSEK